MTSARERILDAYEAILAVEGERHATLDAVAARAKVSKGGLIYHFASKERLAEAMCARLLALAAEQIAQMREADEGPARFYIRTSRYDDSPLDRALVAVARLQQADYPNARRAYAEVSANWLTILENSLGDDDLALTVKLIGDGLYYEALFEDPAHRGGAGPEETEGVLRVLDRIIVAAGELHARGEEDQERSPR